MLRANSNYELECALKKIDISVPRRSEGRTKKHTERYAIAHLVSTLLKDGELAYPFELLQRERPDFLLKVNGVKIGVEHTEAVPQNEAHKTVLRDSIDGPDIYFISRHEPGEPKRNAQKLIHEIQTNNPGSGWPGDSVEREWSEAMLYFVNGKVETFADAGFEKYETNWLLIYDNWNLPAVDRKKASDLLLPKLNVSACFVSFDRVFIITGDFIVEFYNDGYVNHRINNIWS